MPTVRQDMVSSQARDSKDLPYLQVHSLGHAKEAEQRSMTIRQSLAARNEERKLRQREAAAQLAEVPATTEVAQ